jgi:hypothetical protein
VTTIAGTNRQDSIAWTEAPCTEFVGATTEPETER